MTSDSILGDPAFRSWADRVAAQLVPMLEDSAVNVTLLPEHPDAVDVKLAVELGLSLLLGKPLLLLIKPGAQIPHGIAKAADLIIEADVGTDAGAQRAAFAVGEFCKQLDEQGQS